jgi:hypothetical protein
VKAYPNYGILVGLFGGAMIMLAPRPAGSIVWWGLLTAQLSAGAVVLWRRSGMPFASASMAIGAATSAMLVWLATSSRSATSRIAGACVQVVDGKVVGDGSPQENASASSLTFSPDGAHVAYASVADVKWENQTEWKRTHRRVYLDGRAGPDFESKQIFGLTFSPDSRDLAYASAHPPSPIPIAGLRSSPT